MINKCEFSFILLLCCLFVFSCSSVRIDNEGKPAGNSIADSGEAFPVIENCWFQQVLLRNAVSDLAGSAGFSILLSNEVNKIDNLAIESPNLSGKRLNVVLDQICGYLNRQYRLHLYWTVENPHLIKIYQRIAASKSAQVG